MLSKSLILQGILVLLTGIAGAVPNPLIQHAADCGVLRLNGEYYLMGTGSAGKMHVSRDLLHWQDPVHVFSMDNEWATGPVGADWEIHACDISLRNGLFHLYWSVNYREEVRAIGHAVADEPLGPYLEPVKDRPFDGRIDPQVFVDEGGDSHFYTVKFNDGNVIWGQPMADPWTLAGEPVQLLFALKDTWEWQDHKVNEAPEVVEYRGRYYLVYNANHTSQRYGHYAIGVAEADAPMGFRNENKYAFPVLTDNRERLLREARVIVPLSLNAGQVWRYTEDKPDENWAAPTYEDSTWPEGKGAFGNRDLFMMRGTLRTDWHGKDIWLRKRFVLKELPSEHLQIFINHDAGSEAYLNGVKAFESKGKTTGYAAVDVPRKAREALRVGENVLAVHCTHDGAAQYVDAGLIDPVDHPGEPLVGNCGQPNLVRGPNGFEWWLVYFALYNGSPARNQAVDRVFFHGRELVVDGPTTARTLGYHPPPAFPTFCDRFDEGAQFSDSWAVSGGQWRLDTGQAIHVGADGHRAMLRGPAATHYLVETTLRFTENATGQAGLIAWRGEGGDEVRIGLDRDTGAGFYERKMGGASLMKRFDLPRGFNWTGWHTFRVERNAGALQLWLDEIRYPLDAAALDETARTGTPGLFAHSGGAAFGWFNYTRGWDEWGAGIQGWEKASPKDWPVEEHGFKTHLFKGDPLAAYEFAVQIHPRPMQSTPEKTPQQAGVYAVFVDPNTYLRVAADPAFTTLTLSGKRNGEALETLRVPVPKAPPRHHPPEETGHNLRVVKVPGKVLIFIDGQHVVSHQGTWPESRVGLFATMPCDFEAITCYDRGSRE